MVSSQGPKAIVLGAGFIGLSVALCLYAAGYDVEIRAEKTIAPAHPGSDPRFASAFPAAAILPHFLPRDYLPELMHDSQRVFSAIQSMAGSGVRSQQHLELWEEFITDAPTYLQYFEDCRKISELDITIPKRPGVSEVYGYGFKIFFADMPSYGEWLKGLVAQQEIKVIQQTLDRHTVKSLEADVIVNCLGIGASQVFPEHLSPGFVSRGVLLKFECNDIYTERPGQPVSYYYTPKPDVYQGPLYFYPRERSAVIGGTQELRKIDPKTGQVLETPVEVPDAIEDINRELVFQLTGRELPKDYQRLVGYRHFGGTPGQQTLSVGRQQPHTHPIIIDCNGLGGYGVTLSWGVGIRALTIANEALFVPGFNMDNLFALLRGPNAGVHPYKLSKSSSLGNIMREQRTIG